jgi:UMF1 family MFS transporter
MATEYAWSRQGNARPKTCADLKDDKLPETECVRCVEGYGSRIITLDSISGLQTHRGTATLRLPGGINPTSFFFTMVSISVVIQAAVFISVGSLGDYANFRRRGLVLASTVGALTTCCYIVVPISPSLYWLGGVLLIVANVCLGISVVFYNSYLPLMVDDSPEVQAARAASADGSGREEEVTTAQAAMSSEFSSRGLMWGYIGGAACLILSFVLVTALSLAGMSAWWTLGIGCALSGVWWLAFSLYAFTRLPERAGPPLPRGVNVLAMGWVRTYRLLAHVVNSQPQTGWFLVLFFVFSDGYTTVATVSVLFANRELCMGILELAALAILVPICAAIGGYYWFRFQAYSQWTNKAILVTNLTFLSMLPLWGCVGFFSKTIGLRTPTELYILAVWFGLCLGSAQAYTLNPKP